MSSKTKKFFKYAIVIVTCFIGGLVLNTVIEGGSKQEIPDISSVAVITPNEISYFSNKENIERTFVNRDNGFTLYVCHDTLNDKQYFLLVAPDAKDAVDLINKIKRDPSFDEIGYIENGKLVWFRT